MYEAKSDEIYCPNQSNRLDIQQERKKFEQVLQQPILKSKESLKFDTFYATELKNTHFVVDQYYEKVMIDFYQYIERIDTKIITKNADSIVDYYFEANSDPKVKQLFEKFVTEKFPFEIKKIESKGNLWDTLFKDAKECSAFVSINNKKYGNPKLSFLYTSLQNARGNTDVDPSIDYLSYGVRVHQLASPIIFTK